MNKIYDPDTFLRRSQKLNQGIPVQQGPLCVEISCYPWVCVGIDMQIWVKLIRDSKFTVGLNFECETSL